jgi:hypothetical protein
MSSGKKRLLNGNINGAYSEFKLAIAIMPHNGEVNKLLFETISILCQENEGYCKEFKTLTTSLYQKAYK